MERGDSQEQSRLSGARREEAGAYTVVVEKEHKISISLLVPEQQTNEK